MRPRVSGKFLVVGGEKFYVRGVTYGPFRPDARGYEYPAGDALERDLAQIAANGLNTIRTYTVPPRELLDAAHRHGLRVMVGTPWEQHVAFLDTRQRRRAIEARVRQAVRDCAGHPAILCYAIGNEIPSSIVRWYGARRVERFLKRLYQAAKAEDPEALVTYVNYPTTEYLQLPFLDVVCFNVYLESPDRFEAYLARLHNIAGDLPLLMAELGLDSRRNGKIAQARVLDQQIRATFDAGCAGVFVFAWTDEWHRGGHDIEDWAFGLTDRCREPKPALASVRDAFRNVPFRVDSSWPRISVVVCCYNAARTIGECLEGLRRVEYPNFEVIVVDDGSRDTTAAIAQSYAVRLIRTENCGLSAARNTGLEAATGEIVAYLDSDAWPDPHWLGYLARAFLTSTHAGIGGPNLAPPGDGPLADCIDHAPGNPTHILLSDREAEHIPGCNMAFRKACLQAVQGFDPTFRIAGDDVDICWQLQQRGWTLGFSPAAVVWHHRRNSVAEFYKQQKNYGAAEAMLAEKWPEKHNGNGQFRWAGRVYGNGMPKPVYWPRRRIFHGVWGSAPFQSIYAPAPGLLPSLPLLPEWYLVLAVLGALASLGTLWSPLRLAAPLLGVAVLAPVVQAALGAAGNSSWGVPPFARWTRYAITASLHLLQPLARLVGRLQRGLTPSGWRVARRFAFPWPRTVVVWSERWQAPVRWLERLEKVLRHSRAATLRAGHFDRWDIEVRSDALGAIRMRLAVEEHSGGRQLLRFRLWPRFPVSGLSFFILFGGLAGIAVAEHVWTAVALGVMALLIGLGTLQQTGAALATTLLALREIEEDGVVPASLRKTAPSGSVTRIPVLVHTEEPWRLGVRPPPPRARWGRDGESHEVDRA